MKLNRRMLLRLLGSAVVTMPVVTMPLLSACGNSSDAGDNDEPDGEDADSEPDGSTGTLLRSAAKLPAPFSVPLPIPPRLKPTYSDATTDYYAITQQVGNAAILPGLTTEIWGYNGIFPGPTLVSQRGRRTVVRHRNELPVPTVVHLHGGVTPPEHDGYPTDLVLPVSGWEDSHNGHATGAALSHGEREYSFPLDQPAATLWYHDHRMDFTGPQVYRGLAGFHLLHDAAEDALPLPKAERDIPLMICDRAFAEDGTLAYPSIDPSLRDAPGPKGNFMQGVLGDVMLVNGTAWPTLEVTNTRYRFRILNASNARRYRLVLDPPPPDGQSFIQIGSDVGLLAQPVGHQRLEIAPAERFDVIIDFAAYPVGTQVTLVNRFVDGDRSQIMRFDIVRAAKDESHIPAKLVEFEPLARTAATVTRQFRFAREVRRDGTMLWSINGQVFDPARFDAEPRLGATEVWRLTTNVNHPVHLHLAHFQVLTRNEGAPGDYDAGWKDTIDLQSGEQAEIIARFNGYRGRYVFHCHNLEHEDMMMGNFQVV